MAPDGQSALFREDDSLTFQGHMWLFWMVDGELREVPTLGKECGSKASSSPAPESAELQVSTHFPGYVATIWLNDTTAIAIDQHWSASGLVAINTDNLTVKQVITVENTESRYLMCY